MKTSLFLMCLIFSSLLSASTRGDLDYNVGMVGEKTLVYFTQEDSKYAESISSDILKILPLYERSFGHVLDEKLHLILKSSQNHQVMNAFSTQYPHNLATFYAGGLLDPNYFAATSWIDLLSAHEIAHNFQMNVKDNWISQTTSSLFGNTPYVLLGFIPLFSHPNFFLPQFIVEGNAVLNESLYDNGGRLYNGEHFAITLSYIQSDRFTPKNLINKQLEFPYGLKPYVLSGHFHYYLAKTYGLDRVNRFFKINSQKAFAVLSLNDTFKRTFGKSYEVLFLDFIKEYKRKSNRQKILKEKIIARSKFSYLMDRDNKGIYFYTQNDSDTPVINYFNTTSFKVKKNKGEWFEGRPIFDGKSIYTSSSQNVDYNRKAIALYDKDQNVLSRTVGKSVQSIKNGKILYFDIKKSYGAGALYVDDHFISYAHSSAIFDSLGNVYYFKNSGMKRILYRNRSPLFSYNGHWGYPVDVVGEAIYFIAPTEYGSSLYKYMHGNITRSHSADNIVDAKFIKEDSFLVRSVDDWGYSFQITKGQSIDQKPFVFNYHLKNHTISLKGDQKIDKQKRYNSLTSLRYEGLWFSTLFSSNGRDASISESAFLASLSFSDPMQFNSIYLTGYQTNHLKFVRLRYLNQRYRLSYAVNISHVFDDSRSFYNPYTDVPLGLGGEFVFNFPWWIEGKQSLSTTFGGYLDYEDAHKNPLLFTMDYKYSISYGIAKYPETLMKISSFAKYDKKGYDGASSDDVRMFGGAITFGKSLMSDLYIEINGKYVSSNQGNGIRIDNYRFYDLDVADFSLKGLDYSYYAKKASTASIYMAKNFNYGMYHRWFPIGVRREALFVKAETMNLEYEGKQSLVTVYPSLGEVGSYWERKSITEVQAGIELEILIGHLLPMNMQIYYLRNNSMLNNHKLTLNISGDF